MMRYKRTVALLLWIAAILSIVVHGNESGKRKKKDIRDFTDRDLEKLYEEWEENDEDQLEEDELPPYKRPPKQTNFNDVLKTAKSPEELMKISKKGQSVMMFVGIGDVDGKRATKQYTEKWTALWQSSLYNNHIDVQLFVIEDNRAIFMFSDGSQAWDAKDFLLKQPQVSEVSLEGRQFEGPAHRHSAKQEL
uniref:LDLR chaperone MESD n=1 Tax=Ascaris lumbricoides TaxID=6252 RepID=A0A0M3I130_ASCLU